MIVVDRIEGDIAVLDVAGRRIDFPVAELPEGTAEGDALEFTKADAPPDENRLQRLKSKSPQGPGNYDL